MNKMIALNAVIINENEYQAGKVMRFLHNEQCYRDKSKSEGNRPKHGNGQNAKKIKKTELDFFLSQQYENNSFTTTF